jgi:hypothetical protein
MCVICYNFSFVDNWMSHDWLWRDEKLVEIPKSPQQPMKTLEQQPYKGLLMVPLLTT